VRAQRQEPLSWGEYAKQCQQRVRTTSEKWRGEVGKSADAVPVREPRLIGLTGLAVGVTGRASAVYSGVRL